MLHTQATTLWTSPEGIEIFFQYFLVGQKKVLPLYSKQQTNGILKSSNNEQQHIQTLE
jgi:hypothetical protein